MKRFILLILIFFVHNYLNVDGIQYEVNHSLLSQNYGCLEKTNVTVLVPDMSNERYLESITSLLDEIDKDPCITVFYFDHKLRETILWEGDPNLIWDDFGYKLVYYNFRNIVQEFYYQNSNIRDNGITKVLLVPFQSMYDIDYLKTLENIYNQTAWEVIVLSLPTNFRTSQLIPKHRIVPIEDFKEDQNHIINLVRNPYFDNFEFHKHINVHDSRFKCLKNKSIHLVFRFPSLVLFNNIATLVHNAPTSLTKILLYDSNYAFSTKDAWSYYEEKLSPFNFSIISNFSNTLAVKENLLQETKDIYLIWDYDGQYRRNLCADIEHSLFSHIRSETLFFYGSRLLLTDKESRILDEKCRKKFGKVKSKLVESKYELFNDLIEEVLSASCF